MKRLSLPNMVWENLRRLGGDDDGQALVEYALIILLIGIFALAALQALGTSVSSVLTQVTSAFP
jgi:Flp pilus assembly pilin Flp